MFNFLKKNPSNRSKLELTDELVKDFLNGTYEKKVKFLNHVTVDMNGYETDFKLKKGTELLGLRAIEVTDNKTDVDIIFTKAYRGNHPRVIHKDGLKPFVWSKNHSEKTFFTHNIVALENNKYQTLVSDTHVLIQRYCETKKRFVDSNEEIDGVNVRILKKKKDGDTTTFYVRYKIKAGKEWDRIVKAKQKLYGVDYEEQIAAFDKKGKESFDPINRMKTGFKNKYTIANQGDKKIYSDNPYFYLNRYNKPQKIKGTLNNLLDFFREGGLSPRGTKYLDEDKLKTYFKGLAFYNEVPVLDKYNELRNEMKAGYDVQEELIKVVEQMEELHKFYLGLSPFRSQFKPFTKNSCDWDKILTITKLNRFNLDKKIVDDVEKVYDKIKNHKDYTDEIFNIQLNENKLVEYVIDCYTFDSNRDQGAMVKWMNTQKLDIFREIDAQLFFVNSRQQYMIQTGRRLFKGIDNYEELDVLTVDIETTAKKGVKNKRAALSSKIGRIFQIGIGSNKGFQKFLHAKEEKDEKQIIIDTYEIIAEYQPDILLTYNGEGFDFPFLEGRLEELGCIAKDFKGEKSAAQFIRNLIEPFYEDMGKIWGHLYKRREKSIVKVGGDTEEHGKTIFYGWNTCDVMFAVARAAAIDTSMPNKRLKDNIIHANLAAADRVYIQGDMIGAMEADTRKYWLNTKNGEYFVAKKEIEFPKDWSPLASEVKKNAKGNTFYGDPNQLYMYGEDGTFSSPLVGCINSFPMQLHYKNSTTLLSDANTAASIEVIEANFLGFYSKVLQYDGIVCSAKGIGNCLQGSPKVFQHLRSKLKLIRINFEDIKVVHEFLGDNDFEAVSGSDVVEHYQKENLEYPKEYIEDWANYEAVSGSFIVKKYLEDDIDEPYMLDKLYSQASFAVVKWLPNSYDNVTTMGGANVWKLILSCWSYINCIAIPDYEPPHKFTGGLVGMVSAGFHRNIVKIDYSSLYPAEFLEHVLDPDIDITGIYKMLVKFGLYERLNFKKLKNEAKALVKNLQTIVKGLDTKPFEETLKELKDLGFKKTKFTEENIRELLAARIHEAKADQMLFDKKQLPLKILINSFYGMLGAPRVSPFCHLDSAWQITCSGRQHMRHLIHWFKPLGFKIIYFHTDGANFVIPEDVNKHTYTGKGLNWLVEKGKEYVGVEACVAKYNDEFMQGRMGVDIDEYCISLVNFAKANFTYLQEKHGKLKISHVGGAIDKKTQSQYIKTFLKDTLMGLLEGEEDSGFNYVKAYYKYCKLIHDGKIVAGEICSRQRFTVSWEDYLKRVKNGGNVLAYYELAHNLGINIEVGDYIRFINIGDGRKNSSDKTNVENVAWQFGFTNKVNATQVMKRLKHDINDSNKVQEIITDFKGKDEKIVDLNLKLREAKAKLKRLASRKRVTDEVIQSMGELEDLIPKLEVRYRKVTDIGAVYEKDTSLSMEDAEKVEVKMVLKPKSVKFPDRWFVTINCSKLQLNIKIVAEDELEAIVPYNTEKYIDKFNSAIDPIWVAFDANIREQIPTPNKKEVTGDDYDRKANQRGYFSKEQLQLTSGTPLAGKENKQQDLDELLIVPQEEMELWRHLNLSPNYSFDYSELDYEAYYTINKNQTIIKIDVEFDEIIPEEAGSHLEERSVNDGKKKAKKRTVVKGFKPNNNLVESGVNNITSTIIDCEVKLIEVKGETIAQWLTTQIILDTENPPYKFAKQNEE